VTDEQDGGTVGVRDERFDGDEVGLVVPTIVEVVDGELAGPDVHFAVELRHGDRVICDIRDGR
jgi:hypothetical protein